MRLTELLTPTRVGIRHLHEVLGDGGHGSDTLDKPKALALLAGMLANGSVSRGEVERVLAEREGLQSTGIGEGVAIPHGALPQLDAQSAALLIVPEGVPFDAIDGNPVTILFAVIGPKRATGEHLKTLARVSCLLRNKGFREQLVSAPGAQVAYDLILAEEQK